MSEKLPDIVVLHEHDHATCITFLVYLIQHVSHMLLRRRLRQSIRFGYADFYFLLNIFFKSKFKYLVLILNELSRHRTRIVKIITFIFDIIYECVDATGVSFLADCGDVVPLQVVNEVGHGFRLQCVRRQHTRKVRITLFIAQLGT